MECDGVPHVLEFQSRRSPIYSTNAMVSTSQPLASQIGIDLLKKGLNLYFKLF